MKEKTIETFLKPISNTQINQTTIKGMRKKTTTDVIRSKDSQPIEIQVIKTAVINTK